MPVNFADLGEPLTVSAVVEDAETPADRLTYQWSAAAGTISGTGATVQFRAPSSAQTPTNVALTLTVSDSTAAGAGATASQTINIRVHDSPREIADMVSQFLTDFSKQDSDPATILRNFSSDCGGREEELGDVQHNQRCFRIDSYTLGTPSVTVRFDSVCAFRSRTGDACSTTSVEWRSTTIKADDDCDGGPVGTRGVAVGVDWVAAVYEGSRWWLCSSDFEGRDSASRAFKK
jgi:hypothetical protein